MRSFLLRPCKLRVDRFVPIKGVESEWFDWARLVEELAPSKTQRALTVLLEVRRGSFLGLVDRKHKGNFTNFVLLPMSKAGNARSLVDNNPNFKDELEKVFFVEGVKNESYSVQELV